MKHLGIGYLTSSELFMLRKNMYKNERDFQNHYVQWLKAEWWRVYKIPDVNMQIKPFDIIATKKITNSEVYAIELKYTNLKKWVSYQQAYKMLRPNQVGALADIQNHWARSLVVLYNAAEDKVYTRDFELLDCETWEL